MNKKNIIILLLMPFIIALACLTSINITFNLIDTDIIGIRWDYQANEAYRVSDTAYELKAIGQNQKNYPVMNSSLVWKVTNQDSSDTEIHAKIVDGNKLLALKAGNVIISVSNQKGTVQKQMNALIYDNSAIVINSLHKGSGSNIDKRTYFGQYDLKNSKEKVAASIPLSVTCYPSSLKENIEVSYLSKNLSYDQSSSILSIHSALENNEESRISFSFKGESKTDSEVSYSFTTVKDGVNVYSYDDLMYCTNQSENGEVVVLQTSLESEENLENNKDASLFGKKENGKWSFKDDIYSFSTHWNASYIAQWNEYCKTHKEYSPISDQVLVGIHVQKDFYGNGYTLNLHNLTYPYSSTTVNGVIVPTLSNDNLFRGPLSFFTLGNPNGMPLVTAYGQDNIGMYLDGDNITLNDINLKNCDFGNNLSNLEYVGTTLETYGKNITVKNSRISNGKTVMRAYSSDVLLENSLLSYARNFLLSLGSYEYLPVDEITTHQYLDDTGTKTSSNLAEYCKSGSVADTLMTNFISGSVTSYTKEGLFSLQDGFDYSKDDISSLYKGHIEVKDTYFYMSNIASIAFESMFNGPYLYSSIPSLIGQIFGSISSEGKSLVPLEAKNCGGISYPVELTISGKTRFYDYKKQEGMDLTGLIRENILKIANSILQDKEVSITIDDIFPIKSLLYREARKKKLIYQENISVPIAYYGGGANYSKVIYNRDAEVREHIQNEVKTDMLSELLALGGSSASSMTGIRSMMKRCVLACIGFNDFRFSLIKGDGYLYGETPKVADLISNSK